MEDASGNVEAQLKKEVSKDGVKLTVIASKSGTDNWHLSVQNEHGISSDWFDFFPSALLAIEAGVQAIEEEGIEPFIDNDGFEYLFDENV
jgi:hypothetical protein